MFLLLVTVFFSSTFFALTFLKVKKTFFRPKVSRDNVGGKRIPGPTGYPLVGNGLEFIFPNSVG